MSPRDTDSLAPIAPDADDHTPGLSRRRMIGLAVATAGTTALGLATVVAASAPGTRRDDGKDDDKDKDDHDDHDGKDEDDRDDDHGDHDDDKDRDDDDHPGPATRLPDGFWEVRITDDDADAFIPGSLTISPGESVTFVNHDDKRHTATGSGWDTGTIEPGASATVTFADAGSFAYACQFHPVMTGTVIVGAGTGTPAASPEASPASTGSTGSSVHIANLAYEPATLQVPVGSTVTWTNDDGVPHTATGKGGVFDTDTIDAGASASVTFDTAGTFPYVCAFHVEMAGTIEVV